MRFEAETDTGRSPCCRELEPKVSAGDILSFLHAPADDDRGVEPFARLLFQFGGARTRAIAHAGCGQTLIADLETQNPDRSRQAHWIMVENDEGVIRPLLTMRCCSKRPSRPASWGATSGISAYSATRDEAHQVRVYVKRLPDDLDLNCENPPAASTAARSATFRPRWAGSKDHPAVRWTVSGGGRSDATSAYEVRSLEPVAGSICSN